MALRQIHVRMPDPMWQQVVQAASIEDISASEFVRQAVLARLVWAAAARARRRGVDLDQALADAKLLAEQLLLADEEAGGG